ncbi:MAG TPA: decarboxylase [Burkholderiales bacterium]|nr:decarboxylase [Burkholderiales bacterium]
MPSIGMIVPLTNTVNEAEWKRMAPEMRFPLVRMALHPHGDPKLFDDLRACLDQLGTSQPDVIAYACTAGSMVQPLDSLAGFMSRESGRPAVATAPALVHACRALGLKRVSLATPYHDALNEHEKEFLAENGIQVVAMKGLGIGAGGAHEYVRIAKVSEAEVYAHCLGADHPDAEGMIVSCTDFRTLGILPRLEAELGKPVVSSNLATFWMALRAAGVDQRPKGYGRLLEQH